MRLISQAAIEQLVTDGFAIQEVSAEMAELILATFQAAREFFKQDLEEKMANRHIDDWGYRPFGIEYSASSERPDLIESFSASFRNRDIVNCLSSDFARKLYRQMLTAIDALELLAESLTIHLAETLTQTNMSSVLTGSLREWSCLQLNHAYFEAPDGEVINDLHEDGNLITLACSTGSGLELLASDGRTLPITTKCNEVVVMPGEIMWLLSGGYVRPLYHRVRSQAQEPKRLALLFFGDIDPKLCQAWVPNGTNANIDIGARVLANAKRFGLDGFAAE